MAPTLPDVTTLATLPDATLTSVLDLLFEPSDELHTLALPTLRSITFTTYPELIDTLRDQLLVIAKSVHLDPSARKPLLSILGSHPRLGEKKVDSAQSAAEQAQLRTGAESEAEKLAALNVEYEAKFPGLRYVVFVNGRSRDVIMEDMRRRIDRGDSAAEEEEAINVSHAHCKVSEKAESTDAGRPWRILPRTELGNWRRNRSPPPWDARHCLKAVEEASGSLGSQSLARLCRIRWPTALLSFSALFPSSEGYNRPAVLMRLWPSHRLGCLSKTVPGGQINTQVDYGQSKKEIHGVVQKPLVCLADGSVSLMRATLSIESSRLLRLPSNTFITLVIDLNRGINGSGLSYLIRSCSCGCNAPLLKCTYLGHRFCLDEGDHLNELGIQDKRRPKIERLAELSSRKFIQNLVGRSWT